MSEEILQLACIARDGRRVKAKDFVYRERISKERIKAEKLDELPTVKYETIEDIDDGSKYEWVQLGFDKYGRTMYCNKTGIRRTQTMGEFYGGGIVD